MVQVVVFRLLLFLGGHVDQQIEPTGIRVTVEDRDKLLLIKKHQLLDNLSEKIQKTLIVWTK